MKPIYLVIQEGVVADMASVALDGINAVVREAQANVQVKNFGVWRHKDWIDMNTGALLPYMSVDWYVEQGRKASRNKRQLYINPISYALISEPWQKAQPHWDVTVMKDDLYDDGCNFIIGGAIPYHNFVISTYRFRDLDEFWRRECFKTSVMHELGHVFGLPNDRQDGTIEQSLGGHCTNRFIMRQGLVVPRDWLVLTRDRLEHGSFCSTCLSELHQFFQS